MYALVAGQEDDGVQIIDITGIQSNCSISCLDESMVVILISYAPFNVEKLPVPSEMPKTADIESGSVTFII